MGWDQKDAVGEPLEKGDLVKVFRYSAEYGHEVVGEYVGKVATVIAIEHEHYVNYLQIGLSFGDGEAGWAHQSLVMKV